MGMPATRQHPRIPHTWGSILPPTSGISSGNMQLTVSGNISGNFGIIKTGTGGILQLSGSNSFTGGVIVRDGFFNLANTAAPGSGVLTLGDNTVSASTTSLTLNFDTTSGTYASDITFVRNGQSQTKTIQSRVSNATLNGTITLAQDARFNASAGNTLTINGKITGSTGTVVTLLINTGTVVLANANNDFNCTNFQRVETLRPYQKSAVRNFLDSPERMGHAGRCPSEDRRAAALKWAGFKRRCWFCFVS